MSFNSYEYYQPPLEEPHEISKMSYEGPHVLEVYYENSQRIRSGKDSRMLEIYVIEKITKYSDGAVHAQAGSLSFRLSPDDAPLAHPGMVLITSPKGPRIIMPVIRDGTRTDFLTHNRTLQAIVRNNREATVQSGVLIVEAVFETEDGRKVVRAGHEEFELLNKYWTQARPGLALLYDGRNALLVSPNFPQDYPFPRYAM